MKKLVLFFGSLLLGLSLHAQGLETFDNFGPNPGQSNAYYDGTFTGQDGSTWTFTKARGDAAAEVTTGDQGLMLRNEQGAELISGTLHNGIETLQFSYMQAFSTNVGMEVYVDANLVYTAVSNGEQDVVKTSGVIDLSSYNVTGDFVLTFKNLGSATGQINIDDIEWTAPALSTCDDPTNLAIQNITDQSAEATWTAGGTESEWVIIYGPTGFDPINDLGNPDVYADTSSANPYPISGLDENTDYDVYVIAKCGAADYSGTVGPETFTTDQSPTVCDDPTNLAIQNITDQSAEATWTAGGTESEWVIIYGPTGFDPINDLGNPDVYADTSSANPYPISGLDENTDYDVYVIAKCGAADYSGTVGPETFTTDLGASVDNEVFNNFSYYPNPVHDQLSLKAEGQIESVIVYDLLGNDVIALYPNTMETQITTKGLQNGVYLVKVTLNGLQKTFRLVKK